MSLGDNIYRLRKNKKLNQEQLAERINVSRQTISNWELEETTPNPEQLKKLSKYLGVSVDELLDNNSFVKEKEESINPITKYRYIIFIIVACCWGLAAIITYIDGKYNLAYINIGLCIVWVILAIVTYKKKSL